MACHPNPNPNPNHVPHGAPPLVLKSTASIWSRFSCSSSGCVVIWTLCGAGQRANGEPRQRALTLSDGGSVVLGGAQTASRGRGRATVAGSCGRAGGAHSFPCDRRVEELLPSERDLASRVQEHAERRDREEQAVEDHDLRRVSEASEVLRRVCAALLCVRRSTGWRAAPASCTRSRGASSASVPSGSAGTHPSPWPPATPASLSSYSRRSLSFSRVLSYGGDI